MTLTWGQILSLTFQGHAIHVSMRLDEANMMVSKLLLYHFKQRSYHWKTVSLKNAVFDLSWPLTLKRLILGEIWRHLSEIAFQELSFAFFRFGVAIIVPEIMAGIPDKTIFFENLTFDDLCWPQYSPERKKWPKWLRTGSLRAVDRRIARPSSFPSFWVRGGSFWPPTMAKVAETATRARVKTWVCTYVLFFSSSRSCAFHPPAYMAERRL